MVDKFSVTRYTILVRKYPLRKSNKEVCVKYCKESNCKEKYYANEWCRKHYRIFRDESKKRWLKQKNNPELLLKHHLSYKKWFQKMKKMPEYVEYKEKQRIRQNKYYYRDKCRREYLRKWKKNLSTEKKREYRSKDNATRNFGSWKLRESVILRDGEKCTKCGISRQEHYKKWYQDLHVDHKDNYGRNIARCYKNNSLENLITLCIRCHRSKSAKEQQNEVRTLKLLYPGEFNEELRGTIRKRDGFICQDCHRGQLAIRRKLDVHHVDGNKYNNDKDNLLSLCCKCHFQREMILRTQRKSTKSTL